MKQWMSKLCLRKPKPMKNKMIIEIYACTHWIMHKNKIQFKIETVYFLIIKMANAMRAGVVWKWWITEFCFWNQCCAVLLPII